MIEQLFANYIKYSLRQGIPEDEVIKYTYDGISELLMKIDPEQIYVVNEMKSWKLCHKWVGLSGIEKTENLDRLKAVSQVSEVINEKNNFVVIWRPIMDQKLAVLSDQLLLEKLT